jgi:hypothetical protein
MKTAQRGRKSILLILIAFAISCKSDDPFLPSSDWDYFPLRVGASWIYAVEETTILRAACTDDGTTVSNYELRVVVSDSFPNTDKGITYSLQRSKRFAPTENWVPIETWTATVTGNRIITNESNINFVKLTIPLADGLVWNGNLFNNKIELNNANEDDYKATLVGKPYTNAAGLSFDKTATVIQNDIQTNILYRDTRSEVYAFGTGLVYKESYLLNYFANSTLPCYAINKTQKGTLLKQSLKEYNK